MTSLEIALAAWITFHAELGVEIKPTLLAPATEAQIVAVEQEIGYRLPEDLRELYLIANGQLFPYGDERLNKDLFKNISRWAPLFGQYEFMSLDKAMEQYRFNQEMYQSDLEFRTKFNAANPDQIIEPSLWEVREGDPVDSAGWNPSWFSFAGSGPNGYTVDLSPPDEGTVGQVVLFGADEAELQVVANSVTDLMTLAAARLDPSETHRYEYSSKDDWAPVDTVFFDMDFRKKPYNPSLRQDDSSPQAQWHADQSHEADAQSEKFRVWLSDQGVGDDVSATLVGWAQMRLVSNTINLPSVEVLQQMQEQIQGQAESGEQSREQSAELAALIEQISQAPASWQQDNLRMQELQSMASEHLAGGRAWFSNVSNITQDEALEFYGRYKLEMGEWDAEMHRQVNALQARLKALPIKPDGSFGMTTIGSMITICQSEFNEETYKSTETCFDIDIDTL